MRFTPRLLLLLIIATVARPCSADYAIGDLRQYNLVVVNNLTTGSDVEGRTIVGGTVSGNSETFGTRLQNKANFNNTSTLIVGGSLNASNNIENGNVFVGTTATAASQNFNGTGSLQRGDVGNISTNLANTLKSVSNNLAAMTGTALTVSNNAIQVTPTTSGVNVFTVSGSLLASASSINLSDSANASSIIINVTGGGAISSNVNFTGDFNTGPIQRTILFNFENATSVTLGTELEGSLLAYNATLSGSHPVDGSVWVSSFNQTGEVHLPDSSDFNNNTTTFGPNSNLYTGVFPTSVPEPTTILSTLSGLAIAGGIFARKKRTA